MCKCGLISIFGCLAVAAVAAAADNDRWEPRSSQDSGLSAIAPEPPASPIDPAGFAASEYRAEPAAPIQPVSLASPLPPPVAAQEVLTPVSASASACCTPECNACGYDAGCDRGPGCCCIGSTCDMVQHYPYFPAMHGYYYFRPYNWSLVPRQQEFVSRWGGDVRHPYANEVFQSVYAEYQKAFPMRSAPPAAKSSY